MWLKFMIYMCRHDARSDNFAPSWKHSNNYPWPVFFLLFHQHCHYYNQQKKILKKSFLLIFKISIHFYCLVKNLKQKILVGFLHVKNWEGKTWIESSFIMPWVMLWISPGLHLNNCIVIIILKWANSSFSSQLY